MGTGEGNGGYVPLVGDSVRKFPGKTAVSALLVLLCAFVPPAAPAPVAEPPTLSQIRPDTALNEAFRGYAARSAAPAHWTGGDSTYSVRTAAGELWLFSDTFLGTVHPDGSRTPTPFVHNSFVLWNRSGPHTATGHDRDGGPTSLVAPPSGWYWARAGTTDGPGTAEVVYARYELTGTGPLDIAWRGNALARFRTGRLDRPVSVTPLPSSARIAWGAWLSRQDRHTYVYGTERAPSGGNFLHLARVTGTDLRRPWQYRTAHGTWSAREADAARLTGPGGTALLTSDELSVVRHGPWYALLTQRADQPFSAELQVAWSRTPFGPFGRARTVYRAPEAGPYGTYRNANVIAYNPHEHPELERRGELVVSYNVNSLDPQDVVRRADLYRPRFLRLTLTPPGHRQSA